MSPIIFSMAKKFLLGAGKNKMTRNLLIAGAPIIWGFVKKRMGRKR